MMDFLCSSSRVIVLLLLLCSTTARAEIFMQFGGVTGEVVTAGYEDQLSVNRVRFGAFRDIFLTSSGSNTTREVSEASTALLLTRLVDSASPLLFAEAAAGAEGKDLTLNFVQTTSSGPPFKYHELVFSNVLVSTYGFYAEGPVAYEELALNVRQIRQTSFYREPDGTVTNTGGAAVFSVVLATVTSAPPPVSGFFDPDTGTGTVTGVSGQETLFPPTLSSLLDTNVVEDGSISIPFRFSDGDTPSTQLVFTAESLDPALIDPLGIQLEIGRRSGTLEVTPRTNASGPARLRLRVSDGTNIDESEMTLNILPVNDPPFLLSISNRTISAGDSLSITAIVGDVDTPVTNLTMFASSSDTNIISSTGFVFTGTGSNRVVDLPLTGEGGASELTLGVSDGSLSDVRTFWVLVNDVASGAPSDITPNPNPLTILEHSPSNTLVGNVFVTDFTPGGDTFTFRLLDDADGRFQAALFAVEVKDPEKLDFESGSQQQVLIQVEDSAGLVYSEYIPITILNRNESPFVASPPVFAAAFEDTDRNVGGWFLNDPDPGPGAWLVQLEVLNGSITLQDIPPGINVVNNGGMTVTAEGSLDDLRPWLAEPESIAYRSFPAFSGIDPLTVTLNDQGSTGVGPALSASDVLDIRVYAHDLDAWLYDTYGPDIDNPALEEILWGLGADGDLDGIANLIEYALGLDPEADDGPSWELFQLDPVTGQIRLNVRERLDPRVAVQIIVTSVVDESQFTDDPTEIELISSTELGNGFRELVFRDPRSNTPDASLRIYRLQVSYTP